MNELPYPCCMSAQTYIAEAIKRSRIPVSRLAELLEISQDGVRKQMARETVFGKPAELGTLSRYAEAMNAILAESPTDQRRFTAESLQHGPDPLPPVSPPWEAEILRRGLPMPYPASGAPIEPPPLSDEGVEFAHLPHFGDVPCGTPLDLGERPATQRPEPLHHLRHIGWRPDSCYSLRAAGHSMTELDIRDGDILVVDRDAEPSAGRIVIVQVNGGTACRKLKHRQDGRWDLVPGHESYDTITVTSRDELRILGVVIGVLPAPKRK